jgi:hypothetical protein
MAKTQERSVRSWSTFSNLFRLFPRVNPGEALSSLHRCTFIARQPSPLCFIFVAGVAPPVNELFNVIFLRGFSVAGIATNDEEIVSTVM